MITVLLIIKTPHELVALRHLFLRMNAKVVTCDAIYASYIKSLQYDPDIAIVEFSEQKKKDYLNFFKVVKNNRSLDQKPFILYGNEIGEETAAELKAVGLEHILTRPLDVQELAGILRTVLTQKGSRGKSENVNQMALGELTKLKDPSVRPDDKYALMRKHVSKLLAFPTTLANVLRVSQNERSGASDLAAVIRTDPSVSAEILKAANSVHFSRGGMRIVSIKDAVVRIGFSESKNIAMSLSVFKMMKDKNYETGFSHRDYWFHCIGSAVIAEKIARTSRIIEPEVAFIGGLLHDFGVLLINEFFNEIFLEVQDFSSSNGLPFLHSEEKLYGFNHNEFIRMLFKDWNFPDSLAESITLFCKPESLKVEHLSQHPLAVIVSVADIAAKSLQIGREADCCVAPISAELLKKLSFPYGFQKNMIESIYSTLNMYNQILKIDQRVFPATCGSIKNSDQIKLLCLAFEYEPFNPIFEYLKSQHYNVITVDSLELMNSETPEHDAVIFTGFNKESEELLASFSANTVTEEAQKPSIPTSKALLFTSDRSVEGEQMGDKWALSRYPIDLRNVDMVLSCLLQDNYSNIELNEVGSFKSNNVMESSSSVNKKIVIAHCKSEMRDKITEMVKVFSPFPVETTSSGDIAYNLVKTMQEELAYMILDIRLPIIPSNTIIEQIKALPQHKRAKFAIFFDDKTRKEDLIPYVKLGVRTFVLDNLSAEIMKSKMNEMFK